MGAVRMLASSDLRRRWGSALLLTVLVGLVGAVVLASVAGARRTSSSLDRFERETAAADIEINPGFATTEQLRDVARIPNVIAVGTLLQLAIVPSTREFLPAAGPVDGAFGNRVDRARVVEGRQARAVDELTINRALADRLGVDVGDRIRFLSFTPEQIASTEEVFDPEGPSVEFRVVGIVRRPLDLGGRGAAGGVVVPTRAFTDAYRDRIGSFAGNVLRVRTAHGAADVPEVVAATRRIFPDFRQFNALNLAIEGEGIRSAINVTTVGIWVLAAVATGAGLIAIAIAMSRSMSHVDRDEEALRALGASRRQRWAASFVSVFPIAVGGVLVANVVAMLASPIFPLGVAREAEPSPGLDIDALALALGASALFAAVVAVGAGVAWLATRREARDRAEPALPTGAAARAGLPAVTSTGIGFALERGRGRGGAPVASSLAGASLGVLGIVAALIVGASLDRLVETPDRFGWTWDYVAEDNSTPGDMTCGADNAFVGDRFVSAVTMICIGSVEIDGRPTTAYSYKRLRGDIGPAVVEGRAARNSHEVALGKATMEAAGKQVGDIVTARAGAGAKKFRIVGMTVFPTIPESDPEPLADGAAFTKRAFVGLNAGDNPYALVRVAPGVDHRDARVHLREAGEGFFPGSPILPAEIDRLRQIDRLPMVLAAFIAAVALLAVGYALVTAVRRRGHDLAILKTLGFRRRQVRATVAWHASTVAIVGLVVGVPLGIVVGKVIWGLIADDLGVSPSAAVPLLALAAVVLAVLLVANVVAAVPARVAARIRPSVVLRSE
jgi:hypothetical protein